MGQSIVNNDELFSKKAVFVPSALYSQAVQIIGSDDRQPLKKSLSSTLEEFVFYL